MNTIEAAVVIGPSDQVIYWHLPPDRRSVALPDSRALWLVFLENKDVMVGQAHSHPGCGWPGPSWEDVTTFEACESGLGKRYLWWIASTDHLVVVQWVGPDRYQYGVTRVPVEQEPPWVVELRRLSQETV